MASKLGKSDAATYLGLPRLAEHLSAADLGKLRALLDLIAPSGEIVLAEALATLYPSQPRPTALAYLRQLRSRLRQATSVAGIDFALHVGGGTRTAPEDRACWFTGPSLTEERVGEFSRSGAALRGPEPVPPQAHLVRDEEGDPRRRVWIFISYAHENRKLKETLVRLLGGRLSNSRAFRFELWEDLEILPGEPLRSEIQGAIEACDLGLLLVSHEFLASEFIREAELPYFVTAGSAKAPLKPSIPVLLARIDFDDDRFNLQGIEARQVFRLRERSFEETRSVDRSAFVNELCKQLLDFAGKHFPAKDSQQPAVGSPSSLAGASSVSPPPATKSDAPRPPAGDPLARLEYQQRGWVETLGGPAGFVPTRAVSAGLGKGTGDEVDRPAVFGTPVDALEFLMAWATDQAGPPFCALLGEYGMGKTTTCEAFTRRMLDARSEDPALPTPIYLDLRHLGDAASQNPLLEEVLRLVSLRAHTTGRPGEEAPSAAEIFDLVQSGKAIAIFDGLDEVLVHLTPSQGQRFTRELWRILPPRRLPARRKKGKVANSQPSQTPRGKLLISCRTHYFRTLRDERTHFLGEDREAIAASDYRALVLLPFTAEQIEEYLEKNLPGEAPERLLGLIRSVHNLGELAERPYTLKLIAGHIPKLEQWKLEGRKVTGVTLYREMAASWLERDAGKHTLTRDHKLRLMERFAAELWASGKRAWSAEDLEQWLIDFLADNPRIRAHYDGKDRELLKEDLRTATFLVRDGEDGFRFAHTSLQEFFLAAHLHRALLDRRFEAWQMAVPSPETLDFLGQMIAEKEEAEELAAFRELRSAYRSKASELALAYALRARQRGHPTPALAGFRLDGARLKGWEIAAPEGGPLLDLRGASFRGANLDGAKLHRIDISDADFGGADLTCAELIGGRGREARFGEAVLVGTLFRGLDLAQADFTGAKLHRAQWLHCKLDEIQGLDGLRGGLFALCEPEAWSYIPPQDRARLVVLHGHSGRVLSCAFSPDGAALASSGADGTVRLWDARSGEPLRSLEGHSGGALACAFSLDGAVLASTGEDGTIRLWNVRLGQPLRSLEGHSRGVWSCAFSPNGASLASAGEDGTIRFWDARSGEPLRVLEGHSEGILSCAFSLDGACLASAGADGTVRLWDTQSGELLRSLKGHSGWVLSCAFSPDGTLASAGEDGTVRLWDVRLGEPLCSLKGHSGWVLSCSFSLDGAVLASTGEDRTIRLWDARSGEPLRSLKGHSGGVRSCAFSPDRAALASSGDDGTVRFWSARSGEPLRLLEGHSGWVLSCVFSPDGTALASAGDDGLVRLCDARSGKLLRLLQGHSGWVWSCAFSPDGAVLASAGSDGTVRLWNSQLGGQLHLLQDHSGRVLSCAFSPDGAVLASTGSDGTVRLWDARSGAPLRSLRAYAGWVLSCAFSTDSATLASAAADGNVRLWNVRSGKLLHSLEGHTRWVRSCAFSPDGAVIATTGADGTVRLWDTRSGVPLSSFRGHAGGILSCAFSPDGAALASAGDDGTVRLWDARTGESLCSLEGHSGGVLSCAFSPDGAALASAGHDGTVRLWDAARGRATGMIELLPNGESASFLGPDLNLSFASPGAWRWLGWLAPDPATGELTRYPAEVFGPLPG